MGSNVNSIIFDWGRTLHDPETDTLYSGVPEMISECSKKYTLVLVSLAKSDSPEGRRKKIEESGISGYFKEILVDSDDKDALYERVIVDIRVAPDKVAIVDDRVIRGIAWGNKKGAVTVWFRNGKFSEELPNERTGRPTFTVSTIGEMKDLFLRLEKYKKRHGK